MVTLEFTTDLLLGELAPGAAREQHSWSADSGDEELTRLPSVPSYSQGFLGTGKILGVLLLQWPDLKRQALQMQGEGMGLPWPTQA